MDLETQSAVDLPECGGAVYAADPSTRIFTAVFLIDNIYHLWVPAHVCGPKTAGRISVEHLWPKQLGAAQPLRLHYQETPPEVVQRAIRDGRPFVAHNAFTFDGLVWNRAVVERGPAWDGNCEPVWLDTLPMARTMGYPGRLNAIGKDLIGAGKDSGQKVLKKFWRAFAQDGQLVYPQPGAGDLEVILRYNIADVELLRQVWETFACAPVEADVIETHCRINRRGVGVDVTLANSLTAVAGESVHRAGARIEHLTGGALKHDGLGGKSDLKSTKKVNDWLAAKGVRILSNERDADGNRKKTLRKDYVTQALDKPETMLDEDSPVQTVGDIDPVVFEVLRLRQAALRITGGKAERAVMRAGSDGRARDLHAYWQAHTGRWSSGGIQVHNLPRPKKGIPVLELLAAHDPDRGWGSDARVAFDLIETQLATARDRIEGEKDREAAAKWTVDDAISSLLRPLFVPAKGHSFAVCDYAAIECRGIAWIAGETELLHALATGTDVYKVMASRIFGRPVHLITDAERQVGKATVLGCGYGLGDEKFGLFCALQGIDLAAAGTSAKACVEAFRNLYPAIAGAIGGATRDGRPYRKGGVWKALEVAAFAAVTCGGVHTAGRTKWAYAGSTLVCELPSGRALRYRKARIEDRVPGWAKGSGETKPTLVYQNAFGGDAYLYGGKIAENVTQAICRDLLAHALVRADADGLNPVLHVHDEIVVEPRDAERDTALGRLAEFMVTPPGWAAGFPISVEGFTSPRYLKSPPKGWTHLKR